MFASEKGIEGSGERWREVLVDENFHAASWSSNFMASRTTATGTS